MWGDNNGDSMRKEEKLKGKKEMFKWGRIYDNTMYLDVCNGYK